MNLKRLGIIFSPTCCMSYCQQCCTIRQTCNCMLKPFHVSRNTMNAPLLFSVVIWGHAGCYKFIACSLVLNWKGRGEQARGGECVRGSTSPSTNQVQDKCQAMERPGSEMKMVVDSLKCQQVFVVKGAHADVPNGTWAQPQSTVDRNIQVALNRHISIWLSLFEDGSKFFMTIIFHQFWGASIESPLMTD